MARNKAKGLSISSTSPPDLSSAMSRLGAAQLLPSWNEHKMSEFLGVSVNTLRSWRLSGKGPRYSKMGRSVRYAPEDGYEFRERNMRGPTSGGAA
jgi:hypothetical protein